LRARGLEWTDVVLVLETIEARSTEELRAAAGDPEALLERVLRVSGPAVKMLAIKLFKLRLEPYLRARGLEWADVVPVLETIDSTEELRAAVGDPEALLEIVVQTSGPVAKKLAIRHLKPRLELRLHQQGLLWADVVPVLETIDSIKELQVMADDPEAKALLDHMFAFTIIQLKPKLEPYLDAQGLVWTDVVPVLSGFDRIHELRCVSDDPKAFIDRMMDTRQNKAKRGVGDRQPRQGRGTDGLARGQALPLRNVLLRDESCSVYHVRFDHKPLGLELWPTPAGVVVTEITSPAAAQVVELQSQVLAIDDESVKNWPLGAITRKIDSSDPPLLVTFARQGEGQGVRSVQQSALTEPLQFAAVAPALSTLHRGLRKAPPTLTDTRFHVQEQHPSTAPQVIATISECL
jgi:hypothetical protein